MRENILNRDKMREDLRWIVSARGNQISEEFRKEIYAIAGICRWDEFRIILDNKKHK